MKSHSRVLEVTNGGNCFSECRCGWAGGVWPSRADAAWAHAEHVAGREPAGRLKPVFLIGPRARGMGVAS